MTTTQTKHTQWHAGQNKARTIETLASARLIASAPDMLSILKEIIIQNNMSLVKIDPSLIKLIEDQIASAEGKDL